MKALLVGNYGIGNLGDELIRAYFEGAYPEVEWRVLSATPKGADLPRLPVGIRSFFAFRWIKTIKAIRTCDAMVFGGGSLFTDIESVRACIIWWAHAVVARIMGLPVILAFQGMGPYRTRLGAWLARFVARHAVMISVRDEESMKRVRAWGLSTELVHTFDPVFSLYVSQKSSVGSKKLLTIIPRHNSGASLYEAVERAVVPGAWEEIRVLLMQGDDPREQAIAQRLRTMTKGRATVVVPQSTSDLMTQMAEAGLVIAERFHGALAALAAGTPVQICSQGVGDKLSTLQRFTGEHPADTAELLREIERGRDALLRALFACTRRPASVGSQA